MPDNSKDISGADQWPTRQPASERFDRFIRELLAEGYTEAEISGGLETFIFETRGAR